MTKPSPAQVRSILAVMTLAASTLVGIALHENYKEDAYLPTPNDVPTIGFGATTGVKMGDKTDPVRALKRLQQELDETYVAGVKKCVKVPLYDYEFGAYIEFAYNIGVNAFCTSTLVKILNEGDYAGACAQISRWDKQNGKVLKGLTRRREEERAICEGRG